MKKNLLLLFVCFSISIFAQKNELSFSIPFDNDQVYDNGFSVNYFRKASNNSYIGIKTRMQWHNERDVFSSSTHTNKHIKNSYKRSIDLVHHWKLERQNIVSYFLEFGMTMVHKSDYEYRCYDCYSTTEVEIETSPPYNPNAPINIFIYEYEILNNGETIEKSINYGFTSSLGIDFHLLKKINLGFSYTHKLYIIHTVEAVDETESQSFVSFNLGYLF